jgi:hypothetical protein
VKQRIRLLLLLYSTCACAVAGGGRAGGTKQELAPGFSPVSCCCCQSRGCPQLPHVTVSWTTLHECEKGNFLLVEIPRRCAGKNIFFARTLITDHCETGNEK